MTELVVVLICLFLNSLFSAYEMAFVSVSRPELRSLAKSGDRYAKALLNFRAKPERTLSIIQVGITLVGAVAATVGGAGASESLEPYFIHHLGMSEGLAETLAVLFVVIPLTFVSVVAGELVPKTLALRNPLKIALVGAKWLILIDRILSPLVTVFEWTTAKVLRWISRRLNNPVQFPQTTVEIDSLSPFHQQFVINMAGIEKKKIAEILIPWTQVVFVQPSDRMEEVATLVFNSGHTRLPVRQEGRIIGVLHTKEFLAYRETGIQDWSSIVRPILCISTSDSVLAVLRLMQEKRNHLAVVMSSKGELLGIVTLEDIIEEVVGDIFDEDDDNRIKGILSAKVKVRSSSSLRRGLEK